MKILARPSPSHLRMSFARGPQIRQPAALILFSSILPIAWGASPPVTRTVTVAQLEQVVTADRGEHDGKLATQIASMRLTERLSWTALAKLQNQVHGRKSRQSLLALASESAILNPPPS